jgi:hypothetical protein
LTVIDVCILCSAAERNSEDPELLEDEPPTSSVEMDDDHVADENILCELPGNPVVVPMQNECKFDEIEDLLSAVRFNNGAAIDSIIVNIIL